MRYNDDVTHQLRWQMLASTYIDVDNSVVLLLREFRDDCSHMNSSRPWHIVGIAMSTSTSTRAFSSFAVESGRGFLLATTASSRGSVERRCRVAPGYRLWLCASIVRLRPAENWRGNKQGWRELGAPCR